MTTKDNQQFENFDRTMHQLIKVPHDKIKAALDAEKEQKSKKKKPKKAGRGNGN